jgi:regulator of cell morphogenesis and NO signaling
MNTSSKIGEIVAFAPAAILIFERLGIDCYRMAARPLDKLCLAHGLSGERVLRSVEEAEFAARASETQKDWTQQPLTALIQHIVQRHHQFIRELFSQLHPITDTAWEQHRRAHPELAKLKTKLQLLERELMMHLRKEEDTVFPRIQALDSTWAGDQPDSLFFRSVRRPVSTLMSVMSDEHELTNTLLEGITESSKDLQLPQPEFGSFRELLQLLKRDLLVHSCLEDYILFPRARHLEGGNPDHP